MDSEFADRFQGAGLAAGAEEEAGLQDIDSGVVEGGEVVFEFAFDAEVAVRRGGVGADGGDQHKMSCPA